MTVHQTADKIAEDSIQELNDLIGELDLFQKEHELSTLLAKCQPASTKTTQHAAQNGQPMDFPTPQSTGSVHSTDEIDAAGLTMRLKATTTTTGTSGGTPYEGQSIGSGSAENGSFNGSFDEDGSNSGFENPSFRYMHQDQINGNGNAVAGGGSQEIILIQDEELSGSTQKYLQDNSEIVTLRCKDTQRQSTEKNYASIGLGGIGNDNLIVQGAGKGRASHGAGGAAGDPKGGNINQQQQQRLSSFKVDAGQQSPQRTSLNGGCQQQPSGISTLKRNHSQNYSVVGSPVDQLTAPGNNGCTYSNGGGGGDLSVMEPTMVVQVSPDGKSRSKPTVSPRPTSLSGSLFYSFKFFPFTSSGELVTFFLWWWRFVVASDRMGRRSAWC